MENDVVSVIIPFYQGSINHLSRAIQSINDQTYKNIEISLCNDGNLQKRSEIEKVLSDVKSFSCLYSENKTNLGIAAARNKAALVSQGKWLLWLDADDTIEPDCIENLIRCSEDSKMVMGNCKVYEGENVALRQLDEYITKCRMFFGTKDDPFITHITSLQPEIVLRNAFETIGGFSEDFIYAEMTEFFLRFLSEFGIKSITHTPDAIYNYYRSSKSVSLEHRQELLLYRKKALIEYSHRLDLPIIDILYQDRGNDGMQIYKIVT